ncbi:hypothetical protein [Chitinophaga tropicalis]|uniref:Uncharacterized protein n=1 Tax=Chitinophaga tropicalis TaxID=2683588 RepID=A0A7K1U8P3_9BACT|nr:hypothetical protein [Chitinophaga tropicalis]MVT10650.1 hypothetical protein [Chitinophaga tropicalis]
MSYDASYKAGIYAAEEQEMNHFLQFICDTLQDLLNFLHKEYPRFIDPDCRIPAKDIPALSDELMFRWDSIQEAFNRKGIDAELSDILMESFFSFKTDYLGNKHVTLYEAGYLRMLLDELWLFAGADEEGELHPVYQLNLRLQSINFNHWKYVNYFTGFIEKEIECIDDPDEKLMMVIQLQKKLTQLPGKANKGYNPENESLKAQTLKWLNSELHYCETLRRLNVKEQSREKADKWDGFKIKTSLSVAELGCFTKLLLDSGVIIHDNKKQLIEFFADFLTSKQKQSITASSLWNKMYTDDTGVTRSLKKMILDLLNYLK